MTGPTTPVSAGHRTWCPPRVTPTTTYENGFLTLCVFSLPCRDTGGTVHGDESRLVKVVGGLNELYGKEKMIVMTFVISYLLLSSSIVSTRNKI